MSVARTQQEETTMRPWRMLLLAGVASQVCACDAPSAPNDAGSDARSSVADTIDVAFPDGATGARCGATTSADSVVRLDGANVRDSVVLCAAEASGRTWASVLVFDATGRLVWAPSARDGMRVGVDARSTAVASAFLTPHLSTAQPVRAQAILDELRTSPYLDVATDAFTAGEETFVPAVGELVDDTVRRLSQAALRFESDASTDVTVGGDEIRVAVNEGVGADFLCEAFAIDSPRECTQDDLAWWDETTRAHRSARVTTVDGTTRMHLEARSYLRWVNVPGALAEAIVHQAIGDEPAFETLGPGVYQVVCTAGGWGSDLESRDVTFASTVLSTNPGTSSPWSLHQSAVNLNLIAVFVDTLRIVTGEDTFLTDYLGRLFPDLAEELVLQLDSATAARGVSSIGELDRFEDQVAAVWEVVRGLIVWTIERAWEDAISDVIRTLIARAGEIGAWLAGRATFLGPLSSAGQAIDRIGALALYTAPFDFAYVVAGSPCPDAGVPMPDAGVDGGAATCTGPAAQPCGDCGTQTRSCVAGTWTSWSTCSGEGVCTPTAAETCMGTGTRTCSASCSWGACMRYCGDGTCDAGESCASCPSDCTCAPTCGDGTCNGSENCGSCPPDCGCASGRVCQSGSCVSCGGRMQPCCTSSSCTGSLVCTAGACRDCSPGTACTSGVLTTCAPDGYSSSSSSCPTGRCASASGCESCASDYCADRGLTSGIYCDGGDRVTCGSAGGCGMVTSRMPCTIGCSGGSCTCGTNYCSASGHSSGTWCDGSDRVTCYMGPGGCLEELSRMTCPTGCVSGACTSCTTAYGPQGFESTTLFSESVTGSQTFSDGAEFFDAGGGSYLRSTTSAHGGSRAMNVYTASSGSAGNTTLAFPAVASSGERLRVSFWVYNPFASSYTIELVRAGATPVSVSIPGGDWFLVNRDVTSTLSTSQLIVRLGLIPNGGGGWTFRIDDLLIERCP